MKGERQEGGDGGRIRRRKGRNRPRDLGRGKGEREE